MSTSEGEKIYSADETPEVPGSATNDGEGSIHEIPGSTANDGEDSALHGQEDASPKFPGFDENGATSLCEGNILKRVLREGSGDFTKFASTCYLAWASWLSDGRFFDRSVENKPHEFRLGKGKVIKAWDEVVLGMRVGEKCLLLVKSPYGSSQYSFPIRTFNYETHRSLPELDKTSDMYFELELVASVPCEEGMEREAWEMKDIGEKLIAGRKRKDMGNLFYKDGKLEEAAKRYEKAIEVFDDVEGDEQTEEQREEAKAIHIQALLNLAQVRLRLNDLPDAISKCNTVLKLDDKNVKGLFRRGQAYVQLAEYDKARGDLTAAIKLDPSSQQMRAELQACIDKEQVYRAKEKNLYTAMFRHKNTGIPPAPASISPKVSEL